MLGACGAGLAESAFPTALPTLVATFTALSAQVAAVKSLDPHAGIGPSTDCCCTTVAGGAGGGGLVPPPPPPPPQSTKSHGLQPKSPQGVVVHPKSGSQPKSNPDGSTALCGRLPT